MELYKVEVVCGNCNWKGKTEVPIEKKVSEVKCPICKCNTLRTFTNFEKQFNDFDKKFK